MASIKDIRANFDANYMTLMMLIDKQRIPLLTNLRNIFDEVCIMFASNTQKQEVKEQPQRPSVDSTYSEPNTIDQAIEAEMARRLQRMRPVEPPIPEIGERMNDTKRKNNIIPDLSTQKC